MSGAQLVQNIASYVGSRPYGDREFMSSLAYTLSEKRSLLRYRLALSASTPAELETVLRRSPQKMNKSVKTPYLGFVFTGMGAQWIGMGLELLQQYPVFEKSFTRADAWLRALGCPWTATGEAAKTGEQSLINEPQISQVLCVVIQMALVDLLASWNVYPTATVGHSGGEIPAAYAAGALSFESALKVAYFRGLLSSQLAEKDRNVGGMLAVGLTPTAAESYLGRITKGKVSVACYNSPSSITVAGELPALEELEQQLSQNNIFLRRLNVSLAYHSPQLHQVADKCREVLQDIQPQTNDRVKFYSSVEGGELPTSALGTEYWVRNMTCPVRFSAALEKMYQDSRRKGNIISMLLEVGPHSALAAPIRQTLDILNPGDKPTYASCLIRNVNAVSTMHAAASALFTVGCPIDVPQVNGHGVSATSPKVLVDLPPYPWNHSTEYWATPLLKPVDYPQMDFDTSLSHPPTTTADCGSLLGRFESNPQRHSFTWSRSIRVSDVTWAEQYIINGGLSCPPASLIWTVIEALLNVTAEGLGSNTVDLRDVHLVKPLVFENRLQDIETKLVLIDSMSKDESDISARYVFHLMSKTGNELWSDHLRGSVALANDLILHSPSASVPEAVCSDPVDIEKFYQQLGGLGLCLGPSFRTSIESSISATTLNAHCLVGPPNKVLCKTEALVTSLQNVLHVVLPALISHGLTPAWLLGNPASIAHMTLRTGACDIFRGQQEVSCMSRLKDKNKVECDIVAFGGEGQIISQPLMQLRGVTIILANGHSPGLVSTQSTAGQLHRSICSNTRSLAQHQQGKEVDLRGEPDSTISHMIHALDKAASFFVQSSLDRITQDDIGRMTEYHRQLFDMLQSIQSHSEYGPGACSGPEEQKRTLADVKKSVLNCGPEGKMLCRIGENLVRIFRREVDPLSLMLEGDLLSDYYRSALDISPGFFEKARRAFKLWAKYMSYRVFNLEHDAVAQGFQRETYDVIVAADVIHATKSIKKTLENLRGLLKPEGKLIFVDLTNPPLRWSMVFGTLPGWWLGIEDGRVTGPTLTESQWDNVLRKTSFSGLDMSEPDFANPKEHVHSVMVSTAINNSPHKYPARINVLTYRADNNSPMSLVSSLKKRGFEVTTGDLTSDISVFADKICIIIISPWSKQLSETQEMLRRASEVVACCRELLWVTRNAQSPGSTPDACLTTAFAVHLRKCYQRKSIVTLDMQDEDSCFEQEISDAVNFILDATILNPGWTTESGADFRHQHGRIQTHQRTPIPISIPTSVVDQVNAEGTRLSLMPPERKPVWSNAVHSSKPDDGLSTDEFNAIRDSLLDEFSKHITSLGSPEIVVKRVRQCLAETTGGGKMTRCFMPLETGRRCLSGKLSNFQARCLSILGWIVEIVHAAILMEDDMMDASIFRRSVLCRHLQPNIGMTAIADARMLRSSSRFLLRLHFQDHPAYNQLLQLLDTMDFHVDLGQITDTHLANTTFLGFLHFHRETYNFIISHKTAWYSFYLPVALAAHYLQLPVTQGLAHIENTMVALGKYFQAQDDYLDLFGDPAVTGKMGNDVHERKLAWPIIEALQICNRQDKLLLEAAYSEGNVEQVKSVLTSMGMRQVYAEFAQNSYQQIRALIDCIDESQGLKKEVFEYYLEMTHQRQK
ncbi:hypothetical protein EYZ11_007155 [Aspergillus tanneri]|uniref:PKS/mFAS DH domain-containing protein n=1 Tax=Aspergillus tanneri TaxID=1220188 RepID=A0A4S3JDN8_9EURO|nr:hypothetical protein EYZ11_007155 [Aspergillus tanneri]